METTTIKKYLNNSASSKEEKDVEDWISSSLENAKKFNLLKARHMASTFNETAKIASIDEGFKRYKRNIGLNPQSKQKKPWILSLKYAAMLVLILGGVYLYHLKTLNMDSTTVISKDVITLKLENGNTQIIKEDGSVQVMDAKGNEIGDQQGNRLVYHKGETTEKISYNTLSVPYGKKFDIILSDSTHIFLNAGSSLRYPVKFNKEQNRIVYLTGEAFFEVAKDSEHPFVVNANGLNVRVLGTKFNVSAYSEDHDTNTVLVQGSVSLYQGNTYKTEEATFLTPGHLASLNKTNRNLSIEKVDVSLYTSWIHGGIIFRHESFRNIIHKLERQYNVVIINYDEVLAEELFTARFDNVTLEHILQTFQDNYGIEYTINKDKIIINP